MVKHMPEVMEAFAKHSNLAPVTQVQVHVYMFCTSVCTKYLHIIESTTAL